MILIALGTGGAILLVIGAVYRLANRDPATGVDAPLGDQVAQRFRRSAARVYFALGIVLIASGCVIQIILWLKTG